MNIKAIAFLSLLTVSTTFCAPAFSQTQEIDVSKIPTLKIKDWRSPSSFSPPWSTPVLVDDDFDGTYLAVFDHNFQTIGGFMGLGGTGEVGFSSNWSAKMVRAYYYTKVHGGGETIREVSSLSVKVGGKVFKLSGEKGNFAVTPALAYALKTAPLEVAMIRAEFADSGLPYSSDIGIGTVTAWRTVYQQAQAPGQVSNTKPKVTQSIAVSGEKPKVKVNRKR